MPSKQTLAIRQIRRTLDHNTENKLFYFKGLVFFIVRMSDLLLYFLPTTALPSNKRSILPKKVGNLKQKILLFIQSPFFYHYMSQNADTLRLRKKTDFLRKSESC